MRLCGKFAKFAASDCRFEIVAKPVLGVVCFRLKGNCDLTKQLLNNLTERKLIYVIPAKCYNKLVVRSVVNGLNPTENCHSLGMK